MANANRDEEMITDFIEIEEFVLSHAKDFGLEDLVVQEEDNVMPSEKLDGDEKIDELIEDYDEDVFWEELIERMTIKDIFSSVSEEDLEKMSEDELGELHEAIREKYEEEFNENGLMNVELFGDVEDDACCCGDECACDEEKGCC